MFAPSCKVLMRVTIKLKSVLLVWDALFEFCLVCTKVVAIWSLPIFQRLVPRASGLPGHVSAEAEMDTPARMQTDNAMMKRIERLALIYLAHIS